MEKPAKSKNKLLKFLPKAASAVSFHNIPFSPGRDKRSENANKFKPHAGRGFSGPLIPIIPVEARRKSRNGGYETQEPTSPKVSCMGQIKHKKKINKTKPVSKPQEFKPVSKPITSPPPPREVKKQTSTIRRLFHSSKPGRKSDASADKPPLPDRAPSLSQMKQFASGRDAFSNFDWTAQIAPIDSDHRNYYSDEERGESEEEDEFIIPFSAPMMIGGGVALEPKKEVNLWKRRTMAPPRPLQLNTMVRSN